MSLTLRRHPLFDVDTLIESMERALGESWGSSAAAGTTAQAFALDLFERDNTLFLRLATPGIRPEDIDVSVEKNVITIKGTHHTAWQSEDTKVYRREISSGEFTRSVRVPQGYGVDSAEAHFENGILTIRIPRVEPAQPETRKIEVKAAPAAALPGNN